MRANHFVTLGLGIGIVGMCAAVGACGTDTSGTCMDTNSCGPGSEGGADTGSDVNTGGDTMEDTGPTEGGGGDARTDAPSDGGAQCDAGLHECSGKCVNEGTDPNHCGSCTNVCPGPDGGMGTPGCDNGVCLVQCAGAGTQYCSGMCVSTTDVNHCGNCTTVCPPPMANGSAACAQTMNGDSCTYNCVSGYHACGMTCLSDGDDPSTDPCVVADGLGIFVSATNGNDNSGDGSKEKPYATIGKAAGVAATGMKRVYACGTFQSGVALSSADDGVTIYGGLDCGTWGYSMATPTTVSPTTTGYALQVTGAATGITFKDFVFTAASAPTTPPQNATTSAQSSIAVFANQSTLKLTRVQVNAGSGQPGAGGGSTTNWTGSAPGGKPATLIVGGAGGGPNSCQDGSNSTGGNGGSFDSTGATSGSDSAMVGALNSGATNTGSCGVGGLGQNGPAMSMSASGAQVSGAVGATGWAIGALGSDGSNGGPAQGGGGGGANDDAANGGSGGGGGAGGCGGGRGQGGATGGSSIGILSYQSALTLNMTAVTSSVGGAGGIGGAAQDGQAGGAGNIGSGNGAGCSGGNGGIGGGGGGGGGGAGGLSAGIVWSEGTAPLIDGVSISNQASGVGGFTTAAAASVGGSGGVSGQGGGNPGATGGSGASVQPADVLSM